MEKYFYIAYGSNLHFNQMKHRCPNSIFLGTGYLKNTELQFKGIHGNCFCTIQFGKRGKQTPIGIFLIDDTDLKYLNRYEGYPVQYRREIVESSKIRITKWLYKDIKMQAGFVYIMNHGLFGAPSSNYFKVVTEGYRACGFDLKYLREAYRNSMNYRNKKIKKS